MFKKRKYRILLKNRKKIKPKLCYSVEKYSIEYAWCTHQFSVNKRIIFIFLYTTRFFFTMILYSVLMRIIQGVLRILFQMEAQRLK